MDRHKLLDRQLARLKLTADAPPVDQHAWKEFLERVNTRYTEADQERYLLERSMEISSRELLELNQKLVHAQHSARLGYWSFDRETGKGNWSDEIYYLFCLDTSMPPPSFEKVMQMICEPDRAKVRHLIERLFDSEEEFEYEFQLKTRDQQRRWAYTKGQPQRVGDKIVLSGITIDITTRKLAEQQLEELHQQVLVTARLAGMADVATSILHNVGNILNSANVSLGLLQENLRKGHYKKLFAVVAMMKENMASLSSYLTQDPKGRLIPEYMVKSGETLENEYHVLDSELNNLNKYLQHIKDIVATQKALSGISGIAENTFLPELIETALKMSGTSFEQKNIHLHKQYNVTPFIYVDSSKLLQILVNLIQNARDALLANPDPVQKQVTISIQERSPNFVCIEIQDNGIGIEKHNLTNIFSFGFTTKKNGHGFGLHSSALAAKELGGSLHVDSTGLNQGAVFCLTLPLSAIEKEGNTHERREQFSYSGH